jgi:hypothetical protein
VGVAGACGREHEALVVSINRSAIDGAKFSQLREPNRGIQTPDPAM